MEQLAIEVKSMPGDILDAYDVLGRVRGVAFKAMVEILHIIDREQPRTPSRAAPPSLDTLLNL